MNLVANIVVGRHHRNPLDEALLENSTILSRQPWWLLQNLVVAAAIIASIRAVFSPKFLLQKNDWLADAQPGEGERSSQSFEQFSRLKRRFPKQKQRIILLCNLDGKGDIGNDETYQQEAMEMFRQFMEIYFSMPCDVTDPLSDTERRKLKGRMDVLPQLQTDPIHKILSKRLRSTKNKTAFCIVGGVTLADLYPKSHSGINWNFVFGEAVPHKGAGVFSFARFTEV
mmetsp:Transcript_23424/g.38760  ORF Transcript_23424/g.38760 Transcript_23424/m.38760 type:complete len:227 (+) Transcript_23424:60-740(+)|eukprot:CAMPEP_0119008140 /NCGR_PEP_ID=MMETSP1176-20130426/3491_1 /TAXON_ID=265551 /ORGANISM="Synedropsis recta cf, Strain CCMP1620" /LENGTH=226 /DNA_ID=CAMNT_0006960417 /DNA_START=60 /DNA_END=740 /DNA_ORIENTATION=-